MLYNKPFDATDPNAGYVNGNPSTSTPGSIPCAEGLEYPQREIVNVITGAGLTPSNGDLTQLLKAVQAIAAGATPNVPSVSLVHSGPDTSGTANAIVISTVTPAVTALADYQIYEVIPANSVTGGCTLEIASFSALPLQRQNGSAFVAGDAQAGVPFLVVKLGSAFRRLGSAPSDYASSGSSAANTVIQNNLIAGSYPNQYPTAGTYTLNVASGQVFVVEECRGGGGGGGGANSQSTAGTGGGGGGRSIKLGRATQATVLQIVVGGGGPGGAAGGGNGGTGGTTSVTVQSGQVADKSGTLYGAGQTLCAATGGGGGVGNNPGGGGGSGGIASGGDINDSGDQGGLAPLLGGLYFGGSGGASPGAGGRPDNNYGAAGNGSSAPGTGGNGSSANAPGGGGHDGRVTIRM